MPLNLILQRASVLGCELPLHFGERTTALAKLEHVTGRSPGHLLTVVSLGFPDKIIRRNFVTRF